MARKVVVTTTEEKRVINFEELPNDYKDKAIRNVVHAYELGHYPNYGAILDSRYRALARIGILKEPEFNRFSAISRNNTSPRHFICIPRGESLKIGNRGDVSSKEYMEVLKFNFPDNPRMLTLWDRHRTDTVDSTGCFYFLKVIARWSSIGESLLRRGIAENSLKLEAKAKEVIAAEKLEFYANGSIFTEESLNTNKVLNPELKS